MFKITGNVKSTQTHLPPTPSIEPSRREAGSACYDHFLTSTTRTGEPLGYDRSSCKALEQVVSLAVQGAGWTPARFPVVTLAGFSKGGVVLNQVWLQIRMGGPLSACSFV